MKLKLGIMTNSELAEWFGIKERSFKNNKKKKLEELRNFADFEECKGKVNIINIKMDEYSKGYSSNYNKIKDKIDDCWSQDGIDTCKRVSLEIVNELKEIALKESTIYNYTCHGKNELYGHSWMNDGQIGSCYYLWCKTSGEGVNQKFERFTEEEEAIKKDLLRKYYGDTTEKQLLVLEMIENGEINKEDAWDVLSALTNMTGSSFTVFLHELEEKIGSKVTKVTYVERKNNFLSEK